MTKPTVKIFDVLTQEETVREMNDEEYSQFLIDKEVGEKAQAEMSAKQADQDAAKTMLVEKLAEMGITTELIEVIKKL